MLVIAVIAGSSSINAVQDVHNDIREWNVTGIVYEQGMEGDPLLLNDTQDYYYIADINNLTSDYYSAKLIYNINKCTLEEVLTELSDTTYFVNIEEDETLYSDAFFPSKNDNYKSSQWYLDAIQTSDAWKLLDDEPGKDIVVAVVDTGVDYTHGDLADNMWINEAEAYGRKGYDDDRNGIVDDIYGANFSVAAREKPASGHYNALAGDPMDDDKDGHGTHVAGIIGMVKGNGGGVGIAYGCRIMAVKAGEADGSFKVSSVIAALDYAFDMGADIINMSFGTYNESAVLKSMLERNAGKCVLVAAAGNDGKPNLESTKADAGNVYPASYPYVLGVMAVDNSSAITEWSNYDYLPYTDTEYEIAAPGYNILSTAPDNKYVYMHGTSMATPMVSAAAAIIYARLDRDSIINPATYVFGQLTRSTTHIAKRTDKDGTILQYPLLNIYDSLTANTDLNIVINRYEYYDSKSLQGFNRELIVEGNNSAEVYCGLYINNLWSKAKNISVNMSIDSEVCKVKESERNIGSMEQVSSIGIKCENMESFSFEITGEIGKSYAIPIKYDVIAYKENSDKPYMFTYTDTITITFNAKPVVADVNNNTSGNEDNNTDNVTTITVPGRVKGLSAKKNNGKINKNVLSWNKVNGAKKYIVYYATKRSGKYRKLATTSKRTYSHVLPEKRTYFYKVRAYTTGKNGKVYGKYSTIIKVKK